MTEKIAESDLTELNRLLDLVIPIEEIQQHFRDKKILARMKLLEKIIPDSERSIVNKLIILGGGNKSEISDFVSFLKSYRMLTKSDNDDKLYWICPELREEFINKLTKAIADYEEKRRGSGFYQ